MTIGTGAVVRAGARGVVTVCTFLTTAIVVRAVGTETFGALAFGLSVVGLIAGPFAGLGTAATRSIASTVATGGRPQEVARALSAVVLLVGLLGAGVVITAIAITQRQLGDADAMILGAAMTLLLFGRLTAAAGSAVARGVGRVSLMEVPATVEVVVKLGLAALLLVLAARGGWIPLAIVYAGAGLATVVAAVVVVRVLLGSLAALAPAARAGRNLVVLTAPFVAGSVAYRLIHGFDVAVLGALRPGGEVGAYAPSLSLVDGLVMLVPGLLAAMYVTVATGLHTTGDRRGFSDLYLAVAKVSLALTVPAFTLLAVAPTETLRMVYGADFPASPTVIRILLGGYFATVALGFNGQALVAAGAWSTVGKALVVPAITMVLSALLLIPPLGGLGAAIATAISFVVLNASLSTALHRTTGVHPLRRDRMLLLGTVPIAIAIATLSFDLLGGGWGGAVAATVVAWGCWLVLVVRLRLLTPAELWALAPRRQAPDGAADR